MEFCIYHLSVVDKLPLSRSLLGSLRPVYIVDFCRGNSMQLLSRLSCNFKIARVNQVRFSVRFVAAISQGFQTGTSLNERFIEQNNGCAFAL